MARRHQASLRPSLVAPAPLDFRGSVAALRSTGAVGSCGSGKEKSSGARGARSTAEADLVAGCIAEHALRAGPQGADRVSDGSRRRAPAAHPGRARISWPPPRVVRCEPSGTRSCGRRLAAKNRERAVLGISSRTPAKTMPAGSRAGRLTADAQRRRPRRCARHRASAEPPEPAAVSRPSRDPHHAAPRAREARQCTRCEAPPRSSSPEQLMIFFSGARFHRHRGAEGGDAAAEVERSRRNQAQDEGSLGAGEPWSGSVAALRDSGISPATRRNRLLRRPTVDRRRRRSRTSLQRLQVLDDRRRSASVSTELNSWPPLPWANMWCCRSCGPRSRCS